MGTNGDYWGLKGTINFMGTTGKTVDVIPQVSKSSHYLPHIAPVASCPTTTDPTDVLPHNYFFHVMREGGLSLFESHGKGTGARVSHCDSASRGQKFSQSENFS